MSAGGWVAWLVVLLSVWSVAVFAYVGIRDSAAEVARLSGELAQIQSDHHQLMYSMEEQFTAVKGRADDHAVAIAVVAEATGVV